jgi:hypothetical protein
MNAELNHLNSLELNLSNERVRLAEAATAGERELRSVWVSQLENEISAEIEFLAKRGITIKQEAAPASLDDINDDELLAKLFA